MGKVVCVKCKQEKFVNPNVEKKRIAKFGSVEKYKANYLCLNCRDKKAPTQPKKSKKEKKE
jgi:hypothetical protein